ncbi:hypothetical protein ABIB68_006831 [Bradyrhizobium sp. F1.2.2]
MPTRAQMEKMATGVARKAPTARGLAPGDDLPLEYWQELLDDPRADGANLPIPQPERSLRLDQIPSHLLRIACRRCSRTVEIQKVDAVRLYGPDATWRSVSQRLLDNTCTQRTGRHEEDGCWPSYDV